MAIGVEILDKLQLDIAFGDSIDGSWTIRTDSRLLVVDDDETKVSRFSDDDNDEERALVVLNCRNKVITLLSIDHALIDNHEGGIADCAVMDEKKLEFVEFKTNAYGNSEQSIRENFEKACSQLKETLRVFSNKLTSIGIDLMDVLVIECRIIVAHRYPRATAIKQDFRAQFAQDTHGINLLFERLVQFV